MLQLVASLSGSGHIDCSLGLLITIAAHLYGTGDLTGLQDCLQYLSSNVSGQGTVTSAALVLVLDFVASVLGQGDAGAALNSLILLSAGMSGQSTVTADTYPLAQMGSSVSGHSSVLQAHIDTIAQMLAHPQGSGTISHVDIKTLLFMLSNVLGSGDIDAGMFGKCFMDSEITQVGEMVTAESCARAVWSALAAAFNEAGTMGNKVNSASAAGDPWTAEIPGTYVEGSAGELLDKIRKLIKDNQALILAK